MCLFLIWWAFLSACQEPNTVTSLSGRTMGTGYIIKYVAPDLNQTSEEVKKQVDQLLVDINQEMSTYIPDSEISKLNQNRTGNWIELSPRLFTVVVAAESINQLSDGAFDATIGPLVNLWGFGPDGKHVLPNQTQIDQAKQVIGFEHLQIDKERQSLKKKRPDIYLDLSAIAKGYGVDLVGQFLSDIGIDNYMVDIGGEIKTRGTKKGEFWKIGIETPDPSSRTIQKILAISNMAVATSGGYRNFFESGGENFSHTINPKTGYPIKHRLASVTVFDPESCMNADALATTLMILGPQSGMSFAQTNDVAAYFIYGVQIEEDIELAEAVSPQLKFLYPDLFAKIEPKILSQ